MPSLAERLEQTRFRPSGFDYLRLSLAVAVIISHSALVCYGVTQDWSIIASPFGVTTKLILPMFFALSGFLVAGSLERSKSIVTFLGLRAIRIYPALGVEVILSAFLVGPLFTTFSLPSYFLDPMFHRYLLNVIGDVHFALPGVFTTLPDTNMINSQLWTIPWELACYMAIASLAVVGVVKRRWLAPAAVIALTVAFFVNHQLKFHSFTFGHLVPGVYLVVSFLCGVGFYLYREHVTWNPTLGAVSGIVMLISLAAMPYKETGYFLVLVPPAAAYFTIYLGLTDFRKIGLIKGADFSYGIYLYGFVMQQVCVSLGTWSRHWYINLGLSLPLTAAFAAFSWYFVEKPALKLRPYLMRLEDFMAAKASRKPARTPLEATPS